MKLFAHFEVVGLFDDNGDGKSGFTNHLEEGNAVYKTLQLEPHMFQPGTTIRIEVAECPACSKPSTDSIEGICPCGHNWKAWCQEKYKSYEPKNESQATS